MKVIGGSFGSGKAYFSASELVIEAGKSVRFSLSEIKKSVVHESKEKKFGVFGFLVGAILLSIILFVFFNIIGVIVGVVVAFMGSYYTTKEYTAEIELNNGDQIFLVGSKKDMNSFVV